MCGFEDILDFETQCLNCVQENLDLWIHIMINDLYIEVSTDNDVIV